MNIGSNDMDVVLEAFCKWLDTCQEHIMMSLLLRREEEERVTSYSGCGKAESSVCTINSTSSRVVASVRVKA